VVRVTLDFLTTIADDPGPPKAFRSQCRSESAATRRTLELPAAEAPAPAGQRPRWGIGTRGDPCEPAAPIVVRIAPGSPAAQAGLALGDRVIAVDGAPIANQADMIAKLGAAGDHVLLDVDRKGRFIRLEPVVR